MQQKRNNDLLNEWGVTVGDSFGYPVFSSRRHDFTEWSNTRMTQSIKSHSPSELHRHKKSRRSSHLGIKIHHNFVTFSFPFLQISFTMAPRKVKKVMTLPINVIFGHLQVRFCCCSMRVCSCLVKFQIPS